jgi:hypothetical protein
MINIQDIIPYMRDGWVAMDSNCKWGWYEEKPIKIEDLLQWSPADGIYEMLDMPFCIAPADDWTKSLIKVGGK